MKSPKYVITADYHYIGSFVEIAFGKFPVYRFPSGNRIADEWELEHGSDDRKELEI